jgi:O-antigen/teichoic acid export membrane protein
VTRSWNVWTGDLADVGRARIVQALLTLSLSIAWGVWAASGFGLVSAYVVGILGSAAFLLLRARRVGGLELSRRWTRLRATLRRHGGRIVSACLLGGVNALTTSSILLLLILWYSSEIVGWYGLVFRVATAPIALVTSALVQSFWTDAALLARSNPGQLRAFYLSTVVRLVPVGLAVSTVALLGPWWVAPVFGPEEWAGAGALLAAVSPYLLGLVVFSPTTHLVVYDRAHWQVASDATSTILAAAGFSWLASRGAPAWGAILTASLILLAGYGGRFYLHLLANRGHHARNSTSGAVRRG